jgi:hypothetical protein
MTPEVTTAAAALARRRFLRQGQLAGAAIGGIAAALVVGLLPTRMRLVEVGPELGTSSFGDILVWFVPVVLGMALGFVAWLALIEHRRPTFRGGGWTAERDWAITGGMFVGYILLRVFTPSTGAGASGLYPTGDAGVFLLVDAPIDVAMALIRFLASATIAAVLLRLVFDWLQPLRARRDGRAEPETPEDRPPA